MKQKTTTWIIAIIFCFISASVFAQQNQKLPKWSSELGYWVVETKTISPLDHVIRFYNNDDVLVYSENINGVKLNPAKRKVRMMLKSALETAVTAWQKNKVPSENKDFVTAILK